MKTDILNYINTNTDRSTMDCLSTKDIANHFNISTEQAYSILKGLSSEKLITHLDPIGGDNFKCADWIAN